MMEATQRRQQLLEESTKHKEKTLKEKELIYLEQAYEIIQSARKKASIEKQEMISRAMNEQRNQLFQKRQEIVQRVFDNAIAQIRTFKKTQGYKQFLSDKIQKACEMLGKGEYIIYLDKCDMHLASKLENKIYECIGKNVIFMADESNLMGGCRVLNKTEKLVVDFSLRQSIEHHKEQFLENSKLFIDLEGCSDCDSSRRRGK